MYRDFKLFFICCKLLNFIPLQFVFSDDYALWGIRIYSFQTLLYVLFKSYLSLLYFLNIRRKTALIPYYSLYFCVQSLDLSFLIGVHKFMKCILLVENFETLRLVHLTDSKAKYFWSIWLVYITLHSVTVRVLVLGSFEWKAIFYCTLYVFSVFPLLVVPIFFMMVCTELARRFDSLRETCDFVGYVINNQQVFNFSTQNVSEKTIESVRMAYAILSQSVTQFLNDYTLAVTFYLLLILGDSFYCWYIAIVLSESLTWHQQVRFLYNCSMIYFMAERMDNLKKSVSNLFRLNF